MTTFTDIVAAVVVHSSGVALSHFGVTLEPTQVERLTPAAEQVVARTPARRHGSVHHLTACPRPIPAPHAVRV